MPPPVYQLLLVVEKPDEDNSGNEYKWGKFLQSIRSASTQGKDLQTLSENVLLLTLHSNLSKIGDVLVCLNGLNYRYALFDTEIRWHEVRAGG
jgi:hypothetical protein